MINLEFKSNIKLNGIMCKCYLFQASTDEHFKNSKVKRADDDKIFILQKGSMLKSYYSEQDIAEQDAFNNLAPLKDGDPVVVSGKNYIVKIVGNYFDAGYLIEV
jgi:hypothetical protein